MPSPRSASLAACLVSVVFAACTAAPRTALAPLEPLRHVEAELLVQPSERGLARPRFDAWTEEQIAASPRLVSIRVRFVELDARAARERLGEQVATLVSAVVPREAAERLFEGPDGEGARTLGFSDSSLVLHEHQHGYVSVTDQRAYVSGFTIRSSGTSALADPRVEAVTQGMQLSAVGTADAVGGQVTLDLCLESCRFDPEFGQRHLPLAGSHMTLQEPRGLSRTLSTRVTLARDETLIVGGSPLAMGDPERAVFALIQAEVAASEQAAD